MSASKKKIAPSILSADFAHLADEIKAVEEAGADIIHIDVMDGHFVPNFTIGPPIVAAIKKVARRPLDVHLMMTNPDDFIPEFVEAGSDYLTVHVETCPHLHRTIQSIKEKGIKAGMDSLAADGLAREVIAQAGYGDAFGHSLGHGVGLAVHENPTLSPIPERRTVLKAGSVVTVEPGIYLTGWGGVRLEDMVRLTDEGAEVLNGLRDFYEWPEK